MSETGRRKSVWGNESQDSGLHRRDGSVTNGPERQNIEPDPEATEWANLHAGTPAPQFDAENDQVDTGDDHIRGRAEIAETPTGGHANTPDSTNFPSDSSERISDGKPENLPVPASETIDGEITIDWEDDFLWEETPAQDSYLPSTTGPDNQALNPHEESQSVGTEPGFAALDTLSEDSGATSHAYTPKSSYTGSEDTHDVFHANSAVDRYVYQDEYYSIVSDILGIAMSGDPEIQSLIRSFQLTRDPEVDARQRRDYEDMLSRQLPLHGINIPNPADTRAIIDTAYDELLGIGPLGPLWRDDDVTDILVNGPNHVTVEANGKLMQTPVTFRDLRHLQDTARRLASKVDDRGVSRTNPLVTVQLPGARVQIAWEPVAVSGASVVIRKHRRQLTLEELLKAEALTPSMSAFLADAVESRATVLVSGATGSGKTTYLNVLSSFIPATERVVVIEDARELHLTNSEVEYLLTKEAASADDTVIVGFAALLRASLRMRPDRIIVGEILDSNGAVAMLEAAFTGHDGTMTTLHANNPEDALKRIAGLLRHGTGMPEDLAREQVFGTFDVVVQVARDASGKRLVQSIDVVGEGGHTDTLFSGRVNPQGEVEFTQPSTLRADTRLAERMRSAGIDTTTWE